MVTALVSLKGGTSHTPRGGSGSATSSAEAAMPFHLLQGALLIQDLADVQGTSQCPDTAWEQSNSYHLG